MMIGVIARNMLKASHVSARTATTSFANTSIKNTAKQNTRCRLRKVVAVGSASLAVVSAIWLVSFGISGADYQRSIENAFSNSEHEIVTFDGETFLSYTDRYNSTSKENENASGSVISDGSALALSGFSSAVTQQEDDINSEAWGFGASAAESAEDDASAVAAGCLGDLPLYSYVDMAIRDAEPVSFDYLGVKVSFTSPFHPHSNDSYRNALMAMPEELVQSLGDRGWTIHVTDKKIYDVFPFVSLTADVPDVAGICWCPAKEIWIVDQASPKILVHEIGHAVDWESGGASLGAEWQEALDCIKDVSYKTESTRQVTESTLFGYVIGTPVCNGILSRDRFFEQYATAFSYYWTDPAELLIECPEAFYYFAKRFGIHDLGYDTDDVAKELAELYAQGEDQRANPIVLDDDIVRDIWQSDGVYNGIGSGTVEVISYVQALQLMQQVTSEAIASVTATESDG